MLFQDRFYLRRLLRCFPCLSHSEPSKALRFILSLFYWSRLLVLFPNSVGIFLRSSFDNLGKNYAMYWVSPRNEFICFWFSGFFKSMIAITFSLFCLLLFSATWCPSHFVLVKKNSDSFHLPGIPHLLISLERRIVSFRDLPGFFGWRRLCRLARPVSNTLVFGRIFLEEVGMSVNP